MKMDGAQACYPYLAVSVEVTRWRTIRPGPPSMVHVPRRWQQCTVHVHCTQIWVYSASAPYMDVGIVCTPYADRVYGACAP